jgi:hypothetical protein
MEEDFKKLDNIQNQVDDMEVAQEEKDLLQNLCFCFEGFFRYKCLIQLHCIINTFISNFNYNFN